MYMGQSYMASCDVASNICKALNGGTHSFALPVSKDMVRLSPAHDPYGRRAGAYTRPPFSST